MADGVSSCWAGFNFDGAAERVMKRRDYLKLRGLVVKVTQTARFKGVLWMEDSFKVWRGQFRGIC